MPTDPPNAPPNAPRADASPSTGGGSFLPVEAQLEVILRGAEDVHVRAELTARLEESRASGRPLRVKVGFDPTRPDLHLGHAVLMQKMRQFQDLGHEVILLVGDFTAMVGDPTGQNDLRPRLTRADVEAAAETYTEQAFRILAREVTVVRRNSEWLGALGATELIELMAKTTVSRMLERNDFAKRFAAQLLDSLVMSAVALAAGLVGGVLVAGMMSNSSTAGLQVVLLLAQLAVTIVIVGYFVRGWGRGQTIGKRAMRIAVTDVSTGGPIGYGRAFGRYLMMMVMALPLYLGFLSLLSEDRRGWHDKAANSRVVKLPDAYR